MREIVFDTETTGLSFPGGDRLVEIGCVELIDRMPTGRTYHAYVNPERSMPAEAFAVHGLDDRFLASKPCFHAIVEELLAFIEGCPLVAHNAMFDAGFLNGELGLCGRPAIVPDRMVDTLAIARVRHPGAKHTLDALCNRYGIDARHRTVHGALLDAELLAQVYIELTGGRQISMALTPDRAVANGRTETAMPPAHIRPPRSFPASEAERVRHAAFMATFDAPLWTSDAA